MSYNPIHDKDDKDEPLTEPLLPHAVTGTRAGQSPSTLEAQDAAYARSLAVDEVSSSQRRAELEANARAWDAHYRRIDPYYYGTWRRPPQRQIVVYRDSDDYSDPYLNYMCSFLFFLIFLFLLFFFIFYYTTPGGINQ